MRPLKAKPKAGRRFNDGRWKTDDGRLSFVLKGSNEKVLLPTTYSLLLAAAYPIVIAFARKYWSTFG
jgi:hypothetical protein